MPEQNQTSFSKVVSFLSQKIGYLIYITYQRLSKTFFSSIQQFAIHCIRIVTCCIFHTIYEFLDGVTHCTLSIYVFDLDSLCGQGFLVAEPQSKRGRRERANLNLIYLLAVHYLFINNKSAKNAPISGL